MADYDRLVERLYRRVAAWGVLRQAVAAVTVWAFVWGTVALAVRAAADVPATPLLWGAAGVPIAAAFAARAALRRVPNRTALRAVLDRQNDCGGLLMADAERPLGAWAGRVPAVELPRVRWRWGRPVTLLAASAAYVALSLLVPARPVALAGDAPLDIARQADRLAEQVRVLKEEKIVSPERADDWNKKVDDLRDRSTGREPAKTLEALDHLADVARQAARQAAESSARQSNQLGQVGAAAEALQDAAASLDAGEMAAMMSELSALARKAAAEHEQVGEELDDELKAALESGKLTPQQLAKLAAAANAGRGKLRKGARKLHAAMLIDAEQLKECEGSECDSKKLCEFLKKNGCKGGLCDAIGQCAGRGGVNEGPGHAELTFGDPSSEEGAKFREESLPPASLAAIRESQTTGLSTSSPKQDDRAEAARSGALNEAAAGGGSADAAAVLPRHRGAVQRYFERPAK